MRYVWFSLGFFGIHLVAYVIAGALTQTWSKDIYHGPDALLRPLMRDVTEVAERQRQGLIMVPARVCTLSDPVTVTAPLPAP